MSQRFRSIGDGMGVGHVSAAESLLQGPGSELSLTSFEALEILSRDPDGFVIVVESETTFASGPGAQHFAGILDNTELGARIAALLGLEPLAELADAQPN